MEFQFNSPSFNGNGYTAHVTGIYQLEQANKQKIKDNQSLAKAEEAAKAEIAATKAAVLERLGITEEEAKALLA